MNDVSLNMNASHLYDFIKYLRDIFDIVRLTDPVHMEVCVLHEDETITREPYRCYAVWEKHCRCEDCISLKAFSNDCRHEKFEFAHGHMYHVLSKAVYVKQERYVLEIVTRTNDETLFMAYGEGTFVEAINRINEKIYVDSLTGLKNRRFFDEQNFKLMHAEAIALIDIDNFKTINDTYGHAVGDEVLRVTAQTIMNIIPCNDTVIRYGGDEMFLVFYKVSQEKLEHRLNIIRQTVAELTFPDHPDMKITLSIGGLHHKESPDGMKIDLLPLVDAKLYKAKQTRNCVVV